MFDKYLNESNIFEPNPIFKFSEFSAALGSHIVFWSIGIRKQSHELACIVEPPEIRD